MEEKLYYLDQISTDLEMEKERLSALRAEFALLCADFQTIRAMRKRGPKLEDLQLTYFHCDEPLSGPFA
jgi:hypothetical protein